jgi:hypothetical protein
VAVEAIALVGLLRGHPKIVHLARVAVRPGPLVVVARAAEVGLEAPAVEIVTAGAIPTSFTG